MVGAGTNTGPNDTFFRREMSLLVSFRKTTNFMRSTVNSSINTLCLYVDILPQDTVASQELTLGTFHLANAVNIIILINV